MPTTHLPCLLARRLTTTMRRVRTTDLLHGDLAPTLNTIIDVMAVTQTGSGQAADPMERISMTTSTVPSAILDSIVLMKPQVTIILTIDFNADGLLAENGLMLNMDPYKTLVDASRCPPVITRGCSSGAGSSVTTEINLTYSHSWDLLGPTLMQVHFTNESIEKKGFSIEHSS